MAQFQSYEKGVDVSGQAVLAFVEGTEIDKKMVFQILEENGLADIKPDGRYSQQACLDAFKGTDVDIHEFYNQYLSEYSDMF